VIILWHQLTKFAQNQKKNAVQEEILFFQAIIFAPTAAQNWKKEQTKPAHIAIA